MTQKEFKAKWISTFVPDLTQRQYHMCYVNQYLWHVFSFEIIPKGQVLVGDDARKAYARADKQGAVTIQLWEVSDAFITLPIAEQQKDWKAIDHIPELYVVSKDWTWTYISTHENDNIGCGPFFFQIY